MQRKSPPLTLDGTARRARFRPDGSEPTSVERAAAQAPAPAAPPDAACLNSEVLLQGHNSVAIVHRGAIYRLQATRQGKLILTK